jgi:hypothetical protein
MTEKMSITDYKKQLSDDKSESTISKQIRQYVSGSGFEIDRLNSGKINLKTNYTSKKTGAVTHYNRWIYLCKKGTPDLLALAFGFAVYIETKIKDGTPSPDQLLRQQELLRAGAFVINADSFESFEKQWLELIEKLKPISRWIKQNFNFQGVKK